MNARCTICDAILGRPAGSERCPECGARSAFQVVTSEPVRHARKMAGDARYEWDFGPDGPVLRRLR